jgi:hypothetical protein
MARGPARLRDWLFSAPGKRRALEVLFLEHPGRVWGRAELAHACDQHRKARMDLYLEPLIQAGVVTRRGRGYQVDAEHPLSKALVAVLEELGALPDHGLEHLGR